MSDIETNKYLNKITNSEIFARSSINVSLLQYLTEATLKGEKPKEVTIGIDVFHYSVDDTNSSNVRVHIHKLRKKLDEYYSKEGINDNIRFRIPKGGYSMVFENRRNIATHKSNRKLLLFVLALILIGLLVNIYFLIPKDTDYTQLSKTGFWNELLDNNKETIIVVGNYFVFRDMNRQEKYDRFWNIRDIQINSSDDLRYYLEDVDSLNARDYAAITDVAYMSFDVLRALPYVIPMLYANGINYQIITSSDFNWHLYDNYNILYIGSFKNMQPLVPITDKLHLTFNNEDFSLTCSDPDMPRIYTPHMSATGEFVDYSLVSKTPRSNNNAVYIFASTHGIGTIASLKYFSQLNTFEVFDENVKMNDPFFKAIFKTGGLERSIETFNLVEFKPLTDSVLVNFWGF